MSNDDSNPMHRIGYGRGDDAVNQPGHPVSRKTMAYSFVAPKGGVSAVAPTEEMVAQPTQVPGSVKNLISLLIEKDVDAWRALSDEVRTQLMELPGTYTLISNEKTGVPNLNINNVELRWNGTDWVLLTVHGK
jgi:hypothetical protein